MVRLTAILRTVAVVSSVLGSSDAVLLRSARIQRRIVVVGGGAAGVFSAIEAAKVIDDQTAQSNAAKGIRLPAVEVVVLEAGRSSLAKVLISGGGRCNVMHDPMKGPDGIAKGYPRGSKELIGPLNSKFGPWDTYEWFSSRGVDLKTEGDGRVFPTTDRSSTIKDTLEAEAKKYGVNIKLGAKVVSVDKINGGDGDGDGDGEGASGTRWSRFRVCYTTSSKSVFDSVSSAKSRSDDLTEDESDSDSGNRVKKSQDIECDRLIFATGSSRIGYDMMTKLGHTLVSPLPSLFSFRIAEKPLHELAGVSVQHSKVRLVVSKEFSKGPNKHLVRPQSLPNLTQKGPLLITHQGLSGPATLRLSAFGAKAMAAMGYKFEVEVSWIPDVNAQDLYDHLWSEKERHPTRLIGKGFPQIPESILPEADQDDPFSPSEFLEEGVAVADDQDERSAGVGAGPQIRGAITRRLWQYILQRCGIAPDSQWQKASKADITKLANELTAARYAVVGRGLYRDEFVTCGGVSLKEISFDTMESKHVPGLFLAGEVLDIDGVTGGYNFQSAWTGGWLAGHSAASSLMSELELGQSPES